MVKKTVRGRKQTLASGEYGSLLVDITGWLEAARTQAGRAVNAIMTATYWRIGQRIFEQEQRGSERAGYGEPAGGTTGPGPHEQIRPRLFAR